jgi:hypothetical protein
VVKLHRLWVAGAVALFASEGSWGQVRGDVAVPRSGIPVQLRPVEPASPAAILYPLNDTGQAPTQCYGAGGSVAVSCSSPSARALNDRQDGMIGRDVTHNDGRDGRRGFSFTKISASGEPLGKEASSWACVRDNVTGLLWENKTDDAGVHDKDNLYKVNGWTGDVAPLITATNAEKLCGVSGWRLPTWFELVGLIDYGAPSPPAIDTDWFVIGPVPAGYYSSIYWTGTPSAEVAGAGVYQHAVDFTFGYFSGTHQISDRRYVRLVNGTAAPIANRFRVSEDGLAVTDGLLGLVWRRCLEGMTWSGTTCTGNPQGFIHEAALTHARTQGWRVPNVKELASILDRGHASPGWDPVLFPGTPALNAANVNQSGVRRPWTSTAAAFNATYVALTTGRDFRDTSNLSGIHHLRLVRDLTPARGVR